jgi:superfamily II DNA or RNA helicase
MDKKEIIADVVETWLRTRQDGSHPGDRTFLFCPTRINAKNLQEAFHAQGIEFGYIDAFTSERSPIFKKFRAKEIQGIASVGCLSTGVDEDVRCIVDAALKRKKSDIVQAIGRGMRPAEGKEYLWLNDHTGNANRFGWFADIYHEKLDDTPPHVKGSAYEKDESAPTEVKRKQCSVCREFLPRGAFKCPNCGNVMVVDDVVTLDGELVDLRSAGAERKAKKERKEKAKKEKTELDERRKYYGWMLHIGLERGFKPGWANHRFHEKFGRWPDGLKAVARKPPKEIREQERKRAIEYRKANEVKQPPVDEYREDF